MNKPLIAALVLALSPALAADPAKSKVKIHELTPSLAMLETDDGCNIGVSWGDDGVLLVDDSLAPLHREIEAAVATLSRKPIRFVVNTHWHYDHVGDNANLGGEGATIIAHDNVYTRLSTTQPHPLHAGKVSPMPHAGLPTITYDHALTLHLNGDTLHLVHPEPAHTDGDTIVVFDKGHVVQTGDLFFSDGYPFIDVRVGGGIDGMIAATEKILALVDDKTQIIPGHGPLANKARLAAFHDMLKAVRDEVAALKHRGMTLEQVQAAKPTARYDASWKNEFPPDLFVKVVYAGLK